MDTSNFGARRLSLLAQAFLSLPHGALIVDSATRLVEVNTSVYRIFNMKPVDVHGKRFGDAFTCSAVAGAGSVEGLSCGQSGKCKNCKLRTGVTAVLTQRATIDEAVFEHDFEIDGQTVTKWFRAAAAPLVADNDEVFALVVFSDITRQKAYEEQLSYKATMDLPTGAHNKQHTLDVLKDMCARGMSMSVAMVDFDHFKNFNDTHGHLMGDRLLQGFTSLATTILRSTDICGRFGGEEFLLILPNIDGRQAMVALERLRAAFARLGEELTGEMTTFSAGLVEVTGSLAASLDIREIVDRVDDLLYMAKNSGRNRILTQSVGGGAIANTVSTHSYESQGATQG